MLIKKIPFLSNINRTDKLSSFIILMILLKLKLIQNEILIFILFLVSCDSYIISLIILEAVSFFIFFFKSTRRGPSNATREWTWGDSIPQAY